MSVGTLWTHAEEYTPEGNQTEKWYPLTEGNILSEGKSVWFSRAPNYLRFSPDGHEQKLTDGQLSRRDSGDIWFSEETVGWHSGADLGIDILIDLGEIRPVDRVVARLLGGGKQHSLVFPREVQVLLSNDKKVFREASKVIKVVSGEKELAVSHPEQYVYYPEEGTSFVEPLVLPVRSEARYVVLSITGATSWLFTDQVAVMEAESGAGLRELADLPEVFFAPEGVTLLPREKSLAITPNLPTPNYFAVRDVRANPAPGPLQFLINLPEGVRLVRDETEWQELPKAEDGRQHYMWTIEPNRYRLAGPLYFGGDDLESLPEDNRYLELAWIEEGQIENQLRVPLEILEIPEMTEEVSRLNASLAWMGHGILHKMTMETYGALGFSMVPVFAYMWEDEPMQEYIREARAHGFKILLVDSPFHRLRQRRADQAEIYNQIRGEKGRYLSPVYTGKYYVEEIERVGDLIKRSQPDYVFYDIEVWSHGVSEAKRCDHAQQLFRESGKESWEAFMLEQGTRIMRDLYTQAEGKGPNGTSPVIGLYNVKASPRIYHDIYDFFQIYPDYVGFSQPSLYVQGNALMVRDSIRGSYQEMGNRDILPWLTAGTYGRFPAHRLEQMILEAYLNGAGGMTYYAARDFDSRSFYYHARALAQLSHYVELLEEGSRVEVNGTNSDLSYSAFGNEKEALVLVGNYRGVNEVETRLDFDRPVLEMHRVEVTGKKEKEKEGAMLSIPADGHLLIHVIFQ